LDSWSPDPLGVKCGDKNLIVGIIVRSGFIFHVFLGFTFIYKRSVLYCRDPYVPASKKAMVESVKKETYVYTAIPITYTNFERIDTGKDEQGNSKSPNESVESKRKKELTADYIIVTSSRQANLNSKSADDSGPDRVVPVDATGGNGSQVPIQSPSTRNQKENTKSTLRSPVAALATELECALLKVMICRNQDSSSSVSANSGVASPANEVAKYSPMPSKDSGSDITQV